MTDIVLSMRRIGRTYGKGAQRVDALVDVDLDVAVGEWVAITGRSGSGKTTVLNVAGGLDEPTTGTVTVEGAHLGDMSKTELARLRRQSIGYVFQDFNLLPTLTAAENVSLPMELDGIGLAESKRHALTSLDHVGLGRMANRYPDQLSGGEQQRVAIARGLVGPRTLAPRRRADRCPRRSDQRDDPEDDPPPMRRGRGGRHGDARALIRCVGRSGHPVAATAVSRPSPRDRPCR